MAELVDDNNDLDTTHESTGITPGPGYYLDSEAISTFKKVEVPA
jgi:hypothetical protein